MPYISILTGAVLQILGIAAYVVSNFASPTALIPAGIGLVFELCGLLALKESYRKHSMHAAAFFALLFFIVSFGGLVSLPSLLSGAEVARPGAVISKSAMALILACYLFMAIQSFISARRARGIS